MDIEPTRETAAARAVEPPTGVSDAAAIVERCAREPGCFAVELDAALERGDHLVRRARFYERARRAIAGTAADCESARARRRAEREAIFAALECLAGFHESEATHFSAPASAKQVPERHTQQIIWSQKRIR